jgi:putative tail protein
LGPVIRLVTIPSVFAAAGRTVREVRYAPTVGELIARHTDPAERWDAIVAGARVGADHQLAEGDEVIAVRVPEGWFFAILIFAVISALVGAGLSLLINLLLGPRGRPNQGAGEDGSAVYNWSGIGNTVANGSPIPVIYGTHRIGGQVLGLFRRNIDATSTDMHLFMLLGLGFGPIKAIGQYTGDQTNLRPSERIEDDCTRTASDQPITDDARWVLMAGTNTGIVVGTTDGHSSSFIAETVNADVTLDAASQSIEAKITTGTNTADGLRFCLNLANANNYHAFLPGASGALKLIKRVAGTDTLLFTGSFAFGDVIMLERFGGCLQLFKNGTLVTSVDADASLAGTLAGMDNRVTGEIVRFDNLKVSGARRLPDGLMINGFDANSYRDVRCDLRLGHYQQPKMGEDFAKVIQAYESTITLTPAWIEYPMHANVQGFQIVLDFPNGLFDQTGGGGPANQTVKVHVELSEDGGAFSAVSGSPFTFTQALAAPFSRTIFRESPPLTGTSQKIRIRRDTSQTKNALKQDRVVFATVNEIQRDDVQLYDDMALLALRIKATEQLSGGRPTVTCLVQGVEVPHWEASSGSADPLLTYGYGTNPADVALDLLLNKRYGLGNFISLPDVDLAAFDAWRIWNGELVSNADYEDEPAFVTDDTEAVVKGSNSVIVTDSTDAANFAAQDYVRVQHGELNRVIEKVALGNGKTRFTLYTSVEDSYPAGWLFQKIVVSAFTNEARHEFHGVFDGTTSSWDALMRICRAGRAVPMKLGNRVTVRVEREASPVQLISEANMLAGSLELQYVGSAERTDILEAQYLDAADNYQQTVAIAGGYPPSSVAKEPIKGIVNLYGITNKRRARREAYYHLNAQRLLKRKVKFSMPLDGLAAEAGDVVQIAATMPSWTHWTGRGTGTPQRFAVSHQVILKAGVTYVALVRTAATRNPAQVTITSAAGTYNAGDYLTTSSADLTQIVDALIAIGTAATLTRQYRLTGLVLKPDLAVEVEGVEYNPVVYSEIAPPPPFCPLPPPGGILLQNCDYCIPLPDMCDCNTGCSAGPGCQCCTDVEIEITCTGAGCACVSLIDATSSCVHFKTGACTGQVCININVTKTEFLSCDANCSCDDVIGQVPGCFEVLFQYQCFKTCQHCWTIA